MLRVASLVCGVFLSTVFMTFTGCSGKTGGPPGPPPPATVTVAKPVTAEVQKYYEYNGYLEAVQTVEIRARVKGFLNEVTFKEGDIVQAQDKLYQIDPRQYAAAVEKAKADIAKAVADIANYNAQVRLSQADLDRLNSTGVAASKSEIDKATSVVDSNKALVEVAKANKLAAEAALETAKLDLEFTTIRAPISGRINRTLITPGNLVGQNDATLLTTIVSKDLFIYFDAPEKDFVEAQRQSDSTAVPTSSVPVELAVAQENGFPHTGTIDFKENKVDPGTGTVRIRGRVTNDPANLKGLYPGLYTRVQVPNGPRKPELVIPEDALMTGQEGRFVYVIGAENKVEKRLVTVGPTIWRAPQQADDKSPRWTLTNPKPFAVPEKGPPLPTTVTARAMVSIEKGLEPTDRVIVLGLQKARPGTPVAPDEWTLNAPK